MNLIVNWLFLLGTSEEHIFLEVRIFAFTSRGPFLSYISEQRIILDFLKTNKESIVNITKYPIGIWDGTCYL